MNPIIMHINYGEMQYDSYGEKSIDDICKMAADIGFNGIEFRGNPPRELREVLSFEEYIDQIAAAKKKYGLTDILLGIQVTGCSNPDKAVREKAIADGLKKAKIAQEKLGTSVCNCFADYIANPIFTKTPVGYEFNGSAAATQEQWDLTVDSFQKLGRELQSIGVKFAFETHMNYIHDLPESTMKLVKLIDSSAVGVNMDFGNTVYFPKHPCVEEAIDNYGEKLFYTHLKNSVEIPGGRLSTALAEGEINHRQYLNKLHQVGFAGPIGIEAPRSGDRVWFAQQDFNYIQAVADAL